MPFPLDQFMVSVRSAENAYPTWRYGQTLFNVLNDGWPEIAKEVQGTENDPFFFPYRKGEPIDRFFAFLATR